MIGTVVTVLCMDDGMAGLHSSFGIFTCFLLHRARLCDDSSFEGWGRMKKGLSGDLLGCLLACFDNV
jgi:hypothetical protein